MRESGAGTTTPYVYVADTGNNRIEVFDYDLNFLFTFGTYGTGDGEFNSPYGVATDGIHIYVTDTGNHRIQYFTMDGVYVGQWGSFGTGHSQFNNPKGICTDGMFVYVVDSGNNRFQIFTMTGTFMATYGEYGISPDPVYLNAPTTCMVDDYYLWIQDTGYVKWYEKVQWSGAYGTSVLPALTITGTLVTANYLTGTMVLPPLELAVSGTLISGRSASGTSVLPALKITGTLTTKKVLSGTTVLPALGIGGTLRLSNILSGTTVLPALSMSGTALRVNIMSGTSILPALTSRGTLIRILITPEYLGIAMNMRNKAITEYTGLSFNSFAEDADGNLYGANSTGIFPITGTDDNGTAISWNIKTGRLDLHEEVIRKLQDAWITARLSGSASLTVYEYNGDEELSEPYSIDGEGPKIHEIRVPFAQGHEGRFIAVELSGTEDFDLQSFKVKAKELLKRRR